MLPLQRLRVIKGHDQLVLEVAFQPTTDLPDLDVIPGAVEISARRVPQALEVPPARAFPDAWHQLHVGLRDDRVPPQDSTVDSMPSFIPSRDQEGVPGSGVPTTRADSQIDIARARVGPTMLHARVILHGEVAIVLVLVPQ